MASRSACRWRRATARRRGSAASGWVLHTAGAGLATRLISAAGEAARRRRGSAHAARMHRRQSGARGFYGLRRIETVRDLLVFDREAAVEGEPGVDLDRAAMRKAHAHLHHEAPSWRRSMPRLEHICDDLPVPAIGVERAGEVVLSQRCSTCRTGCAVRGRRKTSQAARDLAGRSRRSGRASVTGWWTNPHRRRWRAC